jgi:hypothetical protein
MSEINLLDRDVRILNRKLNKGFISQEAVDAMLADLPDTEGQAEWFDPEALTDEEEEAGETPEEEAASDAE